MDLSLFFCWIVPGDRREDHTSIRLSSGIMVMGTGFFAQQAGGLCAVAQEISALLCLWPYGVRALMRADEGRGTPA